MDSNVLLLHFVHSKSDSERGVCFRDQLLLNSVNCTPDGRLLSVQIEAVQSQMTDVPDNRRPKWPNFKQTEEFYNITIFFLILENLLLK